MIENCCYCGAELESLVNDVVWEDSYGSIECSERMNGQAHVPWAEPEPVDYDNFD